MKFGETFMGMTGSRASLGLACAVAMVLAVGQAVLGSSPARAADSPSLTGGFGSATISVLPSPGKTVYFAAYGHGVLDASAAIDVSSLSNQVTADTPQGCQRAGEMLTCALPSGPDFAVRIPVVFHATATTRMPGSYSLPFTLTASNVSWSYTGADSLHVGDGMDVVVPHSAEISGMHPGDVVRLPLSFTNAGSKTVYGVRLGISANVGLRFDTYSNCRYGVNAANQAVCEFPAVTAAPGETVNLPAFSEKITADAAPTQFNDIRIGGLFDNPGAHPVGEPTTLPPDVEPMDNQGYVQVDVVGTHFDVVALGGSASGKAGDVVSVTVGFKNNGPAALDGSTTNGSGLMWAFTVPAHTTVTAAPNTCGPITSAGTTGLLGVPGGTSYRCMSGHVVRPGDTTLATFSLKITSVWPDDKATVSTDDQYRPALKDDNSANNVAYVVINPSTGGLPITGTPTGRVAVAGLAIILCGISFLLVARRRRPTKATDAVVG